MKACTGTGTPFARRDRRVRVALALAVATALATPAGAACFRGINLAGAEFGSAGGALGTDYSYPKAATIAYFAGKGFNSVRLPVMWERLQPELNGPLDEAEFARLHASVKTIRSKGLSVIIDVHNYARYRGKVIGSSQVPAAAFAAFWEQLASPFADDKKVAFGLMNEPHDMKVSQWLTAANAATAAIRGRGAKNLILVPGSTWTGAHSWKASTPDGNNSRTMPGFQDPENNYAFEVHQYFDQDFSGTHASCSGSAKALAGLQSMTEWLKSQGKRGFLGEFGAASSPECLTALQQAVGIVNANGDVWTGWAYWAGGDRWPENYMMSIQPKGGADRAQLAPLTTPEALSTKTCE